MRKFATLDGQYRIGFESKAYGADTFGVIEFNGEEGLSRLYRFEIQLVSESADIDLEKMLANDVSLRLVNAGVETRYHGMLAEFEQLHQKGGDTFYRAVLVPRLWQLSLYRVNEVYVEKSLPDVIKAVLEEAGLTSLDYDIALTAEYTPWSHLCEYQETHFDFLSRLMERDGVYYYFEQGDQREKLIVTDAGTRHQKSPGDAVEYVPMSGLVGKADKPTVFTLVCKQKQLPKTMVLMDYNYRKPSVDLRSEVTVDDGGRGEVYLYGEHADTLEESKALAEIRAQELRCRKRTFVGESTVNVLASGYLKELTGHFRRDFNQDYLVTEVTHEASQENDMLHGGDATAGIGAPFYRNTFTAIAKNVQFRPERMTPKPRIHGTMNAVIDGETSGATPELDEAGRYKVRVTFDRTRKGDAKASQSVRMATPYAGSDHGIHYPLRKGTEVLLTFIDGDPNRPIISSAVPNADTPSVANVDNENSVVNRFRGGIETVIMPSKVPRMAGVGAAVNGKWPEDTSDDVLEWVPKLDDEGKPVVPQVLEPVYAAGVAGSPRFGTLQWEKDNNWDKDSETFDLTGTGRNGMRTLTMLNNVLHLKGTSCERYLGDVVTTIVGDNHLTVRGTAYNYVGDPAASTKKNAEFDLQNYNSDINAEQADSDENAISSSVANTFQSWGDRLSSTRAAANPPGSSVSYTEGNVRSTIRGTNVSIILGDQDTTVQSDSFNKYIGRTSNLFAGNTFLLYMGAQETVNISNNLSFNIGFVETFNLAATLTATLGAAVATSLAASAELYVGVKAATMIGGDYEVSISKAGVSVQKSDAEVSAMKATVSQMRSEVNNLNACASELQAKTNEIKTVANVMASCALELDTFGTNAKFAGLTLIS